MLSKMDYLHAVGKLVGRCESYEDEIVALYMGGSVSRGDFSPGRSDLDIYLVLKEENEEVIERFKNETKNIEGEYLQELTEIHPDPVSLATTTLEKVQDGSSFLGSGVEYHTFMQTGKLLYGRDMKHLIPDPSKKEVRASAIQALKKIYKLAKKGPEHPTIPYSPENPYAYFSTIFRAAHMALSLEREFVSGKWEIVLVARRVYEEASELYSILRKSFGLWEKWERNALTEKEVSQLQEVYSKFMNKLAEKYEILQE